MTKGLSGCSSIGIEQGDSNPEVESSSLSSSTIDKKAVKVFDVMVSRGILPAAGLFDITPELIEYSWNIFQEVIPQKLGTKKPNAAAKRLSGKIAYLNFSKLLALRAALSTELVVKPIRLSSTVKSGFVYLISNKAFLGFVKVGMTTNPYSRLKQYQTYDPHRSFVLEHYKLVQDRRQAEKELLTKFSLDAHSGEWVKDSKDLRDYFLKENNEQRINS